MTVTIEEILTEAVAAGASDVHVTVGAQPKMRIDGELTSMSYPILFAEDTLTLFIAIMTETQRRLFEERGEFDMAFDVRKLGRFRVNAYKQRGGVAMVVHMIGTGIPSPESLGIPDRIMELCGEEQGLILTAGESGSGRSTTLAAIVDRINSTREAHIITLENPVEYIHQHKRSLVDQREIGTDCSSYADGLRAALRQDPDVILVDGMYDTETIDGVVTAAESGHLVLSSVHMFGGEDAVRYMIDAFPAHRQSQLCRRLADVLKMVISQRFLPDEGTEGRRAVFEALQVTAPVRELIRQGRLDGLSENYVRLD